MWNGSIGCFTCLSRPRCTTSSSKTSTFMKKPLGSLSESSFYGFFQAILTISTISPKVQSPPIRPGATSNTGYRFCFCIVIKDRSFSRTMPPGEDHRKQRKLLNPVFSINHMRRMIPMFDNVSRKVRASGTLQHLTILLNPCL